MTLALWNVAPTLSHTRNKCVLAHFHPRRPQQICRDKFLKGQPAPPVQQFLLAHLHWFWPVIDHQISQLQACSVHSAPRRGVIVSGCTQSNERRNLTVCKIHSHTLVANPHVINIIYIIANITIRPIQIFAPIITYRCLCKQEEAVSLSKRDLSPMWHRRPILAI